MVVVIVEKVELLLGECMILKAMYSNYCMRI